MNVHMASYVVVNDGAAEIIIIPATFLWAAALAFAWGLRHSKASHKMHKNIRAGHVTVVHKHN